MMIRQALVLAAAMLLSACSTTRDAHFRNGPPAVGLKELMESGEEPLHIIFLHGMRATRSGGSAAFRDALCARLANCKGPASTQSASITLERVDVSYLGSPVWRSQAEWEASAPIVHRYVYDNPNGPKVVVEEVNWWPLLLPLKCRHMMKHDAALAGASERLLDVCSAQGDYKDQEHYPWLTPQEAATVLQGAGVTGGGAKINRALKIEIMDWGLTDAVISTGPLAETIGKGIGAAFAWAATEPLPGAQPGVDPSARFAVVAESLGSFAAFDYYERHHVQGRSLGPAAAKTASDEARAAFGLVQVLDNTDRLYFLANQIALLQMARLDVQAAAGGSDAAVPGPGVVRWGTTPKAAKSAAFAGRANFGQIVAFHDPSDILTFEMPQIPDGAKVHNVFLVNGPTYLGLFADPGQAHTAHARNSCVLSIMFDKRVDGPCRVAKAKE